MRARFVTTRWSLVLAARGEATVESRRALDHLCQSYWYPLFAFVRRLGHGPDEAQDLVQSFFVELLQKGYLSDFDPAFGRFRVFLQASVSHFVSKQRDKVRTWKRGGRSTFISLDAELAERRYRVEPIDWLTPEAIYERRWALTVLERALARLRVELAEAGRDRHFDALKGCLSGDHAIRPYRELALDLDISEAALRKSVQRLRRRFGGLVRQEVAATVAEVGDVDAELRHLLAVVSANPAARTRG
jgi:RNA polymerase sigma-70 factor (ECF subfamily)